LACSGGGATTASKDGAAGAAANLGGGGGGGAGGAGAAGGASSGGAGGGNAPDAGGDAHDGASPGIAIRGVAYDKFDVPIAGVNVRIGSTTVQTRADGSFEIDGVVVPYDLDAWTPSTVYATIVDRYVGLTRADPALHFYSSLKAPHQATLTVTLSAPLPANEVGNCQFANPARSEAMGQASGGITSGGTFSLSVGWYTGATSISGTLSCLVYKGNALSPTGYDSFGSLPVTLTDGTPASATLPLAPVTTGTVMVGLTLGNSGNAEVFGDLVIPGGGLHPIGVVNQITSNPTSVLIPQVAASTFLLNGFAATTTGHVITVRSGFALSTPSLTLTLPAPVSLTSPADGATMVDTATPLTWSAPAGAAVNINISPTDVKNAEFNIYTAQGSTTIPDLTAQGVPLPSGAGYSWDLTSFGASVTVDDIASPAGFCGINGLPGSCDFSEANARNLTLR
jgi:hypothetical protein